MEPSPPSHRPFPSGLQANGPDLILSQADLSKPTDDEAKRLKKTWILTSIIAVGDKAAGPDGYMRKKPCFPSLHSIDERSSPSQTPFCKLNMLHNAGTMLQKTLFLIFLAAGREGFPKKSRKPQSPRCLWPPRGSMKRSASGKAAKRPELPDTKVRVSIILAAAFSLGVVFLVSRAALRREARPPVLDVDGRKLKSDARYYMVPLQRDRLRGFFSGSRNGTWCPMYVKQAPAAFSDGILVNFAPVGGAKTVRVSTDLNIEFYESNTCPEKPVWTLAPVDKVSGQRFVRLGGVVGNPGPATINNWFKIEKDGDNYKLVFCPRVCETCKQKDAVCEDLGVYRDVYDRWLVLGGRPLTVKFKRFRR